MGEQIDPVVSYKIQIESRIVRIEIIIIKPNRRTNQSQGRVEETSPNPEEGRLILNPFQAVLAINA